ncbi:cutinase transcription factor 1 alpha [Colletotrichum chrysophilum]|uniref:Cutinase transcription factor 1 alpha n=1 Tax=Colletotrichum chrysophilum TaxID=1836956 RepID=A0AAD9EG49_9PEZI|nr:cutinase transcription factor 1 alpha [Colletotrichum chrysophilum]
MNKEFHPRDSVTANDLFIAPGLASGLDAVAWSVCDEGEGILVPQPFYNGFSFDLLNRSNTRVIGVSYQGMEGCSNLEDIFRPEVNRLALEAALNKARGEGVNGRALLISKNRLHFISDEIYAKSVFPNPAISGQASFVSVLSLDLHNVIDANLLHVLYGASKDFCANGLRLGMVYTKNEAMLGAMSSISMFSWSPHVLQDVWASMMNDQMWMESFMEKKTDLMVENYRVATSFFREHNVSYFEMNAGLFIWVDLRHLFNPLTLDGNLRIRSESCIAHQQRELEITDLCARHGIMIAPGSVYMPEEFGWFRVTFSLGKEALEEGLKRRRLTFTPGAAKYLAFLRLDEATMVDDSRKTPDNPAPETPQGVDQVLSPFDSRDAQGIRTSIPQRLQPNSDANHSVYKSSLSYIVEVVHRPKDGSTEPLRVHYPIPASIVDQSTANFGPKTPEDPISLQEALVMPPPEVADQLVRVFFDTTHVAFPVFDRQRFTRLYLQGQASPLVLQTIFLLGFMVGSDDLIQAGGFNDRATARKTYYLRAKALYDADYDADRMNVVACLLLIGFWWAGYDEQKDHFHVQPSYKVSQEENLVGDLPFGRPCRIRDEDCDVEPLDEDDFHFDLDYDQRLIPDQQEFHVSYVLEMTRLAAMLGDVLISEFSPRRPMTEQFETQTLKEKLSGWERKLPENFRVSPLDGNLGAPFWASMLHFNYQYCQILLFRPKSIEIVSQEEKERDSRARMAADAITRNAEDQLSADTIRYAQIHLLMTRLTGQDSAPSGGAIVRVSSSIHPTSPDGQSLHQTVNDNQATSGGGGGHQDTTATLNDGSQTRDFDPYDITQANPHLFYDNFWTSYLDNAFDVDLLIHPNSGLF